MPSYKVDDLLIDLAKPLVSSALPRPCGKPATCYSCTKCTSTGMSRHRPSDTFNSCNTLATASVRKKLRAQLLKILAPENRPRATRRRATKTARRKK